MRTLRHFLLSGVTLASLLLLPTRPAIATAFVQDPAPSPADQCKLDDIAASPTGRIAAAGWERTFMTGGSPGTPLIVEKSAAAGSWTVLDNPDQGFTWHDLGAVDYLPGHPDEDLVAVGTYYPDILLAHGHGLLLRYRRAAGAWDMGTFNDPGAEFHFVEDAVFDPLDPNRLLIAGTRGVDDGVGSCFRFTTMVVAYRLDTMSYEILPTTALGGLSSIVALPDGRFLAVGIAAGDCDYLNIPIVLLIDGATSTVLPNPPPWPGYPAYRLNYALTLADGRVLMVGMATPNGGSHFVTLGYVFDPATNGWMVTKPLDPDTSTHPAGFTNQLWSLTPGLDGRIYAVGRYHYISDMGYHYYRALIESWDGANWRLEETPEEFGSPWNTQLWGVCTHPTAGVWAAGYWDPAEYPDRSLVLRQADPPTGAVDAAAAGALGCEAFPNPFRESTRLRFSLRTEGPAELAIFDVSGRRLRALAAGALSAGEHAFTWDGRDDEGRALSAGVYLARLEAEGASESRSLVLLR